MNRVFIGFLLATLGLSSCVGQGEAACADHFDPRPIQSVGESTLKKSGSDFLITAGARRGVDIFLLYDRTWEIQTDAVRGLPPSQSSKITVAEDALDLLLQAEIRGLRRNQRSVGFAIARTILPGVGWRVRSLDSAFPATPVAGGVVNRVNQIGGEESSAGLRERSDTVFGMHFEASSTEPRQWRLLLETDVSEELTRRENTKVVYAADFRTSSRARKVEIRLSDFEPVVRGTVRRDFPKLTSLDYGRRSLVLRSVAFEVTRGTVEGGRDSLDLIRADLTLVGKRIAFGVLSDGNR